MVNHGFYITVDLLEQIYCPFSSSKRKIIVFKFYSSVCEISHDDKKFSDKNKCHICFFEEHLRVKIKVGFNAHLKTTTVILFDLTPFH